jgi:hypothetical protein
MLRGRHGARNQLRKASCVLLILVLIENIGETSFLDPYGLLWLYSLVATLVLIAGSTENMILGETASLPGF